MFSREYIFVFLFHFLFIASELANLKDRVDRREREGPGTDLPAPGSAALGADKISQLTSEMRILRRRVSEVQEEADGLRRAKYDLEARIRAVEGERDEAVRKNSQVEGELKNGAVWCCKRVKEEINPGTSKK